MPDTAEFEQVIYMRHRPDCDDAYVGRTKDYERRQREHWHLHSLLPLATILEIVRAPTEVAAERLAQAVETSWRRDFDVLGLRLQNEAGRPRTASRPEEPSTGELMPLRGLFKPYFPGTLPDPVRDALVRKGMWVHGVSSPPATTRRPAKEWHVTYSLPVGVTEIRTQAELDIYGVAHPAAWVLGIRGWWRIQPIEKFSQEPDTGSRVFCVDGSRRSLDKLVKVLLTHPTARKSRGR